MSTRPVIPASTNRRAKRYSNTGRIDFDLHGVNDLIDDQGVWCSITPSMYCPNRTDVADTNHALDCPVCGGNQILDLDESATQDWALITGIKLDEQGQVQGEWDAKDAMITVRGAQRIGYWWKVEVLDFASLFNEIIARRTGVDHDKIRYAVAANATDSPYYVVGKDGTRYIKDTDYTVSGKVLTWVGAKPADGDLYSFVYPILPTFRVLQLLNENRYYYDSSAKPDKTPVNLPQRAVIRWDYISKQSGSLELIAP